MGRGAGQEPPALLLLAADDDVLIAVRDLEPGAHVASDGRPIEVLERVRLGHKVAARPITAGERVLRCGVPIGSLTADTAAGAWVHTHNLRSDYLPTFAQRGGVQ